jgi:hypothetical protein
MDGRPFRDQLHRFLVKGMRGELALDTFDMRMKRMRGFDEREGIQSGETDGIQGCPSLWRHDGHRFQVERLNPVDNSGGILAPGIGAA